MPIRPVPLIKGEYYHIFNRGVNKQPIFFTKPDYQRFIRLINYYRFKNPPVRFSFLNRFDLKERADLLSALGNSEKSVKVIAFVLMPNHFHLLLKQLDDDGISNYLRKLQIGYTKYINVKNERGGPLLNGQFKSVHISDDSQMMHLIRYIHLNPYTSYLIKRIEEIEKYPWSSFREHLGNQIEICDKELVNYYFESPEILKSFTLDRADYQRSLKEIENLKLE